MSTQLAIVNSVSPKGELFIKSEEGRALTAYKDSVGVWTIGYGNTNFDAFAVAYLGRKIGQGMTITEDQADYLLHESLKRGYVPATLKAMPNGKQHEIDGGASFHYNTGAIGRASWVNLWRSNAAPAAIRSALGSWNKGGGRVLLGLTRRRAREADMILKGDYGKLPKAAVLNSAGAIVAIPASSDAHPLARTPGMLRLDDKGPEVADLNQNLAGLGFKVTGGEVFNLATDAAIRSFQKAHKQLTVDGVAGPATRAAIKRELDMRGSMKNVTGGGAGATVVTAVGDVASGGSIPLGVFVLIGVAFIVLAATIAYRYRDEIAGLAKR